MKQILLVIFLLLPSELLAGGFANFINHEEGIALLKGDKRFGLSVPSSEQLSKDLSDNLTSGITLKMKMIGKKLDKFEWGKPFMEVSINIGGNPEACFGSVRLSYYKRANFIKKNITTYAEVWSGETVFRGYSTKDLKEVIEYMFDQFLNVYLSANPVKIIEE